MTPPPEFNHENATIKNFIQLLLSNSEINNRSQLILMSGIALNNIELIGYASQIDPTVVSTPTPTRVITIIDSIFGPALGTRFGEAPVSQSMQNDQPE